MRAIALDRRTLREVLAFLGHRADLEARLATGALAGIPQERSQGTKIFLANEARQHSAAARLYRLALVALKREAQRRSRRRRRNGAKRGGGR